VISNSLARLSLPILAGLGCMRRVKTPTHHPQRMHPRYAVLADIASRAPLGLSALSLLVPWSFSDAPSSTENPTDEDLRLADLAVCGFPRTGSTFLQLAIERSLERSDSVWRNHDVLGIPGIVRAGLIVLVPLRNPVGTAISWSVYNSDVPSLGLMRSRLRSYNAWHRQALRYAEIPEVRFIRFDYFIHQPSRALASKFSIAGLDPRDASIVGRHIEVRLKDDDTVHGVEANQTHVPSEQKAALRRDYEALVTDRRLEGTLSNAQDLYESLLRLAPRPPEHLAESG
jgi:hypothetical protein